MRMSMRMAPFSLSFSRRWVHVFVLMITVTVSLCLNFYGICGPYGPGFHGDEPKKVHFVRTGTQDFHHPLLMLLPVRAVTSYQALSDESIARLGRAMSALYASLTVAVTYGLARQVVTSAFAHVASALLAWSPALVVHAHYFKEDALLTLCMTSALWAFLSYLRVPTVGRELTFAVAAGLAVATKYSGILLVIIVLCVPMIERSIAFGTYVRFLCRAAVTSALVFLVVNAPLLSNLQLFCRGATHELLHAIEGHEVKTPMVAYWCGFHLVNSVAPGIGLGSTAVMAALLWRAVAGAISRKELLLSMYMAGYYATMEASPCKPDPDFMRYMLPIFPVMTTLIASCICWLSQAMSAVTRGAWAASLSIVILCPLVWDTTHVVYYLPRDTRIAAGQWLAKTHDASICESYTGYTLDVPSIADVDVDNARTQGVRYLVCSSFQYERYYRGAKLRGQAPHIYKLHDQYESLFRKYRWVEFHPQWRTIGFSNPVIRVIDIDNTQGPPS